jgi:hypothetical protein
MEAEIISFLDDILWMYETLESNDIKEEMKLIENTSPTEKLTYRHCVEYKNKKYIREEIIFSNFHTIAWRSFNEDEYQQNGDIEYFSHDVGWSDGVIMKKENPIPEIEQKFKKTIGENLIYFKDE